MQTIAIWILKMGWPYLGPQIDYIVKESLKNYYKNQDDFNQRQEVAAAQHRDYMEKVSKWLSSSTCGEDKEQLRHEQILNRYDRLIEATLSMRRTE